LATQTRTWLCGLANLCSHSASEICHWKGGGKRRRWHNVGDGGDVMFCPIGSQMWGTNKEKRKKIHLSFIYNIAIATAIHYSLPTCLIRFPYGHARIPFSSLRCLCDGSWSIHYTQCKALRIRTCNCRLLFHGWLLAPVSSARSRI